MADQEQARLKDRSTWLTVFGVAELLMGALFVLIIPMMFFSTQVSGRGNFAGALSNPTRIVIPTISFYGVMAAFWIFMGIGSIMMTRWARALTLIVSWLWLIFGVLGSVAWFFSIPNMTQMIKEAGGAGGNVPENFIRIMIIFQGIFIVFLFAVLPLIFVLVYGSPSVKGTVEKWDSKIRWTDKCPLPVLALCICQVFGALQSAFSAGIGIGIPVFGKFLEGLPMAAVALGLSIILLYLAWATYHRRMAGWFGSLVLLILGTASSVITFRKINMAELYARMGYEGKLLEMMKKTQLWNPAQMEWCIGLSAIICLGFLLYLRRYFKPTIPGMNKD